MMRCHRKSERRYECLSLEFGGIMETASEKARIRKPKLVYDIELLRAMADESRMAILQFLCTPSAGEMRAYPVNYIAAETKMSVSTTSHHLQILRRAGLVTVERAGRERNYRFHFEQLRTSIMQFRDLIRFIDQAVERNEAKVEDKNSATR